MTEPLDMDLRQRFLSGMSYAACTVNIITTDGPAGRAGVTVSAMSSVSADTPRPTLLVCVHHKAQAAQRIIDNGVFCVNVLKDDQSYISDIFAGRHTDKFPDKFSCANWTDMPTGAPRVVDPLVAFDCKVISSKRVGTHYVFFGEVEDLFVRGKGSPLIYANRAYGSATQFEAPGSIKIGQNMAERCLSVACFHTFGPYVLPELINRMADRKMDISINLVEGDQRQVQANLLSGTSEIGLLFDIDLPDELETTELTQLHPYVLLAEGHPLAQKTEITPAELADHPMIQLNAPPSRDYFTQILNDAGVTPNIAFRSSSLEMVRGMVGHGLGYTILATKPASAISYDGKALVSRPLNADTQPSRVVVATRRGVELSKAAQDFKSLCCDFFNLSNGN